MLLANAEQMHWYHVPESCMQFVICVGKAVSVYVHARKKAYATLEHAALEKKATVEIVVRQTGQR